MPVASSTRRARDLVAAGEPRAERVAVALDRATTSPRRDARRSGSCASCACAAAYSAAGDVPSCASSPPIACAGRLLWRPASTSEHVLARAAEDERGAQSGGAAADDETVMQMRHVLILAAIDASASTARS